MNRPPRPGGISQNLSKGWVWNSLWSSSIAVIDDRQRFILSFDSIDSEVSLMEEVVILSAARTPIGKYGKEFLDLKATQLGTVAVSEALRRAGLEPADIEECIMGNVLGAGLGQNPARQAAVGAGLPVEIGSFTVNAVACPTPPIFSREQDGGTG
jgi:hypothetical protein